MPSKSPRQARFMRIACKSRPFAKKADIHQSVACEFHRADKRKRRRKAPVRKRGRMGY